MPRLTFDGARYPFRKGETALDALLRGGANVAFSCRKGSCHVCLLRTHGVIDEAGRRGLGEAMKARGYFLPCVAHPCGDLEVERPDLSELFIRALVQAKTGLSDSIVSIAMDPETNLDWRPGQFVNVRRPDGLVRSYSIASILEEDCHLELHVERAGEMSRWLCDELQVGDELEIQGPMGVMFYDPAMRERPLLLLGTGSGLAPLLGIARDAELRGHVGEVFLYHGASELRGLYLRERLAAMAAKNPRFHYVPCASREAGEGVVHGRANDVAFARHADLTGFVAFFCGSPEVVHDARARAVLAGLLRADLHADPFESAHLYLPDDNAKVASIAAEPELWEALGRGPGLTAILEDFYGRAFEDARIAPFFHHVTKARAIEKQYEFLASIFSGDGKYFGLNPFNAHHWMVISDELFDYREALLEDTMRRHGLAEPLIRRWMRIHEVFRREIVKAAPRGLIRNGVEQPVEGYSDETISVATVCDGCTSEMLEGARGRMHVRTGQLFCTSCAARTVGTTIAPPP